MEGGEKRVAEGRGKKKKNPSHFNQEIKAGDNSAAVSLSGGRVLGRLTQPIKILGQASPQPS